LRMSRREVTPSRRGPIRRRQPGSTACLLALVIRKKVGTIAPFGMPRQILQEKCLGRIIYPVGQLDLGEVNHVNLEEVLGGGVPMECLCLAVGEPAVPREGCCEADLRVVFVHCDDDNYGTHLSRGR
jgi:hypothetical protein